MKYLLTILLACSAVSVYAQEAVVTTTTNSSSISVTESSTDDGYTFSVKVDKERTQQLVDLFKELTDTNMPGGFDGKFERITYGQALVALDTKKRTLSVKNNDDKPKSISSAREIADRIRRSLGLQEAPPPPAPPKY
jgi:hypothetical protein